MDETISVLIKRAEENIRGAHILLKENLLGPAASRTYYAMFYIAQALLFSLGLSFSKHSAVISRFGQEFAKTKKLDPIFHQYLIDGFEARQIADYGITEDIGHEQITQMIKNAEAFSKAAKSNTVQLRPPRRTALPINRLFELKIWQGVATPTPILRQFVR